MSINFGILKKRIIILFMMFLGSHLIYAQKVDMKSIDLEGLPSESQFKPKFDLVKKSTLYNSIFQSTFNEDRLPFFCKIEHQWSKASKLHVKFRIGDVDYVDRLESK